MSVELVLLSHRWFTAGGLFVLEKNTAGFLEFCSS